MVRRLKIKLVEPTRYREDGGLFKTKRFVCPPLTLPYLAALAPDDVDVSIESELFGEINLDEPVDVVGMTVYTTRGMRAYELADEFRRRGVHVVLGGIHASMMPDEATAHADTVVIGEAEATWPQFIEDSRHGRPKARYTAERPPSLDGLPVPRFSLLERAHYVGRWRGALRAAFLGAPWLPVQTARGCPYGCDYCAVTVFSGKKHRTRPIDDVVNEIRTLKPGSVFFVDDDIFLAPERAKALLRALAPLKIRWVGQASIGAARDRELLRLARASGCFALLVGIESLAREVLDSIGKRQNVVEEYGALLHNYRRAGILTQVNLMFGFGPERADVFDEAVEFMTRNRVPLTKWWPVTPLPGTRLYDRLEREGRLKDAAWWLRRDSGAQLLTLKFDGLQMGQEAFERSFRRGLRRFFSVPSILRRMLWPPHKRWAAGLFLNLIYKARRMQTTTSPEA